MITLSCIQTADLAAKVTGKMRPRRSDATRSRIRAKRPSLPTSSLQSRLSLYRPTRPKVCRDHLMRNAHIARQHGLKLAAFLIPTNLSIRQSYSLSAPRSRSLCDYQGKSPTEMSINATEDPFEAALAQLNTNKSLFILPMYMG
jgi:hypothetical protein